MFKVKMSARLFNALNSFILLHLFTNFIFLYKMKKTSGKSAKELS